MRTGRPAKTRFPGCVSWSPHWSAICVGRADASPPSEQAARPSAFDSLTRSGQMPLAWVSCAGSRFRGTNREFVQSNECEGAHDRRARAADSGRSGEEKEGSTTDRQTPRATRRRTRCPEMTRDSFIASPVRGVLLTRPPRSHDLGEFQTFKQTWLFAEPAREES